MCNQSVAQLLGACGGAILCRMTSSAWPEDWQRRMAGEACVLCASLGLGDNDHTVAVAELAYTEVRLERRSRLPGYCIVVWRHGHVAEPTELDVDLIRTALLA
jgi:hypothetical protein